jgi:hypothetical protein
MTVKCGTLLSQVPENKALWVIFGPKKDEVVGNVEYCVTSNFVT